MSSISNRSMFNRKQNSVQLKNHDKIDFSKILIPFSYFSINNLESLYIYKNKKYTEILRKEIEKSL